MQRPPGWAQGQVEGAGMRSFRKAGAAVGDRAGLAVSGEVSRDPESHPSESLMGLKEGAPT